MGQEAGKAAMDVVAVSLVPGTSVGIRSEEKKQSALIDKNRRISPRVAWMAGRVGTRNDRAARIRLPRTRASTQAAPSQVAKIRIAATGLRYIIARSRTLK